MIKTFSLATLVLASYTVLAQQTTIEPLQTHNKFAFKVYNLTTIRPEIKSGSYSQLAHEAKEHDYLHPAVALRIQNKRKDFHEIELSEFSIRKRQDRYVKYEFPGSYFLAATSGIEINTTSLGVRYEYTRPFFKKRNAVVVPAIGVASSLFFERFSTIPYTTNIFPVSETAIGMRGFIVPRLNWYAGKRLFFDLNIPVCVLQASYQHSRLSNPSIAKELQEMSVVKFDLMPNYYSFRIGAGWKI